MLSCCEHHTTILKVLVYIIFSHFTPLIGIDLIFSLLIYKCFKNYE